MDIVYIELSTLHIRTIEKVRQLFYSKEKLSGSFIHYYNLISPEKAGWLPAFSHV